MAELLRSLDNVLNEIGGAERAMSKFMASENEESGNPELTAELFGISGRIINAGKIIEDVITDLRDYALQTDRIG